MLCQDIGWILKFVFPPLLFSVREPSAREAAPTTPTQCPLLTQLSTIHLPRARNRLLDTVGLVPNPLLAHFTQAFYRLASIPQSAVWDLALEAQTEDSSSPQFLMLHFVPTPSEEAAP